MMVEITEEAKKKLRHDLYMDDHDPMRILALSDDQLIDVCCRNYGVDYVCNVEGVIVW